MCVCIEFGISYDSMRTKGRCGKSVQYVFI